MRRLIRIGVLTCGFIASAAYCPEVKLSMPGLHNYVNVPHAQVFDEKYVPAFERPSNTLADGWRH